MQCRGERVKVNKKIRVKLDALPIDFKKGKFYTLLTVKT